MSELIAIYITSWFMMFIFSVTVSADSLYGDIDKKKARTAFIVWLIWPIPSLLYHIYLLFFKK